MKTEAEPKSEYQNVAFFGETLPPGTDPANANASAVGLACEKFGFKPEDFNPTHGGRVYGPGKYGFTFEVQVKWAVAESLAGKNHPHVLNIFS